MDLRSLQKGVTRSNVEASAPLPICEVGKQRKLQDFINLEPNRFGGYSVAAKGEGGLVKTGIPLSLVPGDYEGLAAVC